MSDPTLDGWRQLGCAILVLALKDAGAGLKWNRNCGLPPGVNPGDDARSFLASDGARGLALALDLDPNGLMRLLAGLPEPAQPILPGL